MKRPKVFTSLISRFAILTITAAILQLGVTSTPMAQAAVGSTLATINPSPSGNGRAIAFDPAGGHLYYTNYPDPHIYVIDTAGHLLQTLDPRIGGGGVNIMYGALSWQSTHKGGFLWGGRYDGTGAVDRIDPNTGVVMPVFTFPFPAGDSCYANASGSIDGLAYDKSDNTLWLGDDGARVFFHVTTTGTTIGSFSTPNGLCRSGIAASRNFLWLGLLSGPDTAPYEIGRVAKSDPTTLLQTIPVQGEGPEGLALDHSTFPGKCALWTNQFGDTTTLTARELPQGMCHGVPVFHPVPKPSLQSVGLLTFHTFDNGQRVTRGCVATVVNSANSSTIVTAAHCVAGAVAFGGNPNQQITKLEFAPAHTGACWAGIPSQTPQIDVNQCGNNPYGVFYANPHDVYISPSYVPGASNNPDDFAFIVVRPHSDGTRVQEAVGGFNITWDNNPDPATDPLQSETWTVTSYAADDPSWMAETGVFGPYECNWIGDTNGTGPSASRIGAVLSNQCSSVDPITGTTVALQYPSDKAASFGSSGSPWTNNQNAPGGEITIGAIEAGAAFNCTAGPNNCLRYMQGTKLGTDAENVLAQAEAAFVPGG